MSVCRVPPRVEYALSPLGETLGPILDAMAAWGTEIRTSDGEARNMASSQEFRDYILGQCPGLAARAMMGEYLLYYLGKCVGGLYDNRLLVKPIDASHAVLRGAPCEAPYEGAKEMLLVEDTDDRDLLRRLFDAMWAALPEPTLRRGKREKHA